MAKRTPRQSLKKRRTHDRIIAAAGRSAHKNGLAAASVSRVMHGAGRTIGGFYAHFRSKRAMEPRWSRRLSADPRPSRGRSIATSPPRTATTPSTAVRFRRCSPKSRAPTSRRAWRWPAPSTRGARELAKAIPGARGAAARQRALATLAICVGGLTLARAMRGHQASDEALAACRKWARHGRRPVSASARRARDRESARPARTFRPLPPARPRSRPPAPPRPGDPRARRGGRD